MHLLRASFLVLLVAGTASAQAQPKKCPIEEISKLLDGLKKVAPLFEGSFGGRAPTASPLAKGPFGSTSSGSARAANQGGSWNEPGPVVENPFFLDSLTQPELAAWKKRQDASRRAAEQVGDVQASTRTGERQQPDDPRASGAIPKR
jgi:hypothetical protein